MSTPDHFIRVPKATRLVDLIESLRQSGNELRATTCGGYFAQPLLKPVRK